MLVLSGVGHMMLQFNQDDSVHLLLHTTTLVLCSQVEESNYQPHPLRVRDTSPSVKDAPVIV